MKPLAIDLFCGLGGWTEALLAEGWQVIGFDIEWHVYPCMASQEPEAEAVKRAGISWSDSDKPGYKSEALNDTKRWVKTGGFQQYPGQLVLMDVRQIHGAMFKGADLIVASPPCQEVSYRAQPWKRAKASTPEEVGLPEPSWWNKSQSKMTTQEREEWDHWRVEHPKELPLLGLTLFWQCWRIQQEACDAAGRYIPMVVENVKGAQKWVGRAKGRFGSFYLWGDVESVGGRLVRSGPVEFGMESVKPQSRTAKPPAHINDAIRKGHSPARWTNPAEHYFGPLKQPVWFNDDKRRAEKCGGDWFGSGDDCSLMRRMSSKSSARKAASAQIAKIPYPLAQHIARVFKP